MSAATKSMDRRQFSSECIWSGVLPERAASTALGDSFQISARAYRLRFVASLKGTRLKSDLLPGTNVPGYSLCHPSGLHAATSWVQAGWLCEEGGDCNARRRKMGEP